MFFMINFNVLFHNSTAIRILLVDLSKQLDPLVMMIPYHRIIRSACSDSVIYRDFHSIIIATMIKCANGCCNEGKLQCSKCKKGSVMQLLFD